MAKLTKGDFVQYRNDARIVGVVQQFVRASTPGYVVKWQEQGAGLRGVDAEFIEENDITILDKWLTLDDTRQTFRHRVNDQSPWVDGLPPGFEIQRLLPVDLNVRT